MIDFIKKWIERRREYSRLTKIARETFVAKYPDRQLWSTAVQRTSNGDCIVTIGWWNDWIPPPRTWWQIEKGSERASELPYEVAKELIDIPLLR
jgi:hypothetical protein